MTSYVIGDYRLEYDENETKKKRQDKRKTEEAKITGSTATYERDKARIDREVNSIDIYKLTKSPLERLL